MSPRRITGLRYEPAGRPSLDRDALGELTAIRGANRSGKSTLARLLCGLEPAHSRDGKSAGPAALTVHTTEGSPPWDPADAWLIALADLDPVAMVSGSARSAEPGPGRPAPLTPDPADPQLAGWLARIDTARAALAGSRPNPPAWLLEAARAARPAPPPPPPPPPPVPLASSAARTADRLAQLDAAIAEARAALDAADLPSESALRQALQALRDLDEPVALEAALPDLGSFLDYARRHFPALVVSVAGLVLLAGLLMAAGQSHLAAPFALLAVSGALLVLLAPPARREPVVAHGLHGLHSLARALLADGDLSTGGPDAAQAEQRRDALARLSLPPDTDEAGIRRRRQQLEAQLSARLRAGHVRAELDALVASRDALLRDAIAAGPAGAATGGVRPAPPLGHRADVAAPAGGEQAQDEWSSLLDRRRALIRANVAEHYAEWAESRRQATQRALEELDRLRRALIGTRPDPIDPSLDPASLDPAVLERAAGFLARSSAGRLNGLRPGVDGLEVLDGVGAAHPVERFARSDRQLVALALHLAVAECHHPGTALVLDDVLLGLDEKNLQATSAVLASLAERRQVIVLTASVAVTDALRRARRSTRVLELR